MSSLLRGLVVAVSVAAVGSASAQEEDWDVQRDPSKELILAYTSFDTGISIAVRCMDGGYEALISGLPATEAETRTLEVAFPEDESLYPQQWDVAVDKTVAISSLPAPFARNLRKGGAFQLRVPGGGEGGRNLRYVLDLPASSAAIDETLTACDRPLVDPRDAAWKDVGQNGLPSNLAWAQPPRVQYPGIPRYERGFAVVSCVSDPQGRPQDCVVETEHPRDAGFGDATLRATRTARMTNLLNPDSPIPPSRFNFRAVFRVADEVGTDRATRIIPRD